MLNVISTLSAAAHLGRGCNYFASSCRQLTSRAEVPTYVRTVCNVIPSAIVAQCTQSLCNSLQFSKCPTRQKQYCAIVCGRNNLTSDLSTSLLKVMDLRPELLRILWEKYHNETVAVDDDEITLRAVGMHKKTKVCIATQCSQVC